MLHELCTYHIVPSTFYLLCMNTLIQLQCYFPYHIYFFDDPISIYISGQNNNTTQQIRIIYGYFIGTRRTERSSKQEKTTGSKKVIRGKPWWINSKVNLYSNFSLWTWFYKEGNNMLENSSIKKVLRGKIYVRSSSKLVISGGWGGRTK